VIASRTRRNATALYKAYHRLISGAGAQPSD
jgi:hypothetical protein